MGTVLEHACSRCGRVHRVSELACGLCGNLLRPPSRPASTPASPTATELPRTALPTVESISAESKPADARHLEPWIFLGVGLVTAPIFAATPILQFMGWFLSALTHEMGHAAASWFCGMPAVPAISLAGEGASVHSEQQPLLVVLITAALAAGAWRLLEGRARWIALAVIAVVYPAIALTEAKELLHLLAGHAGELVFATICLWKTLDGGFTQSRFERGLYGTVGWYLLGKNALLCGGLMFSAAARAEYDGNGSFGLTNDYLRVAQDVLAWRLESVAALMLFACVLVMPISIALWRLSRTRDTP